MLRRERGRPIALQHIALAPLRWEELDVDVGDLDAGTDAESRIVRAIATLHERIRLQALRPLAVGCRVRLVGRTRFGVELRRLCAPQVWAELRPRHDETAYFVDRITSSARPAIDLEALARQSDPPGLLARRLVELSRADGSEIANALVRGAASELRAVADQPAWQALGETNLGDTAVRERLLRVGMRALEDLLAQGAS
jgi:hypothetical protein